MLRILTVSTLLTIALSHVFGGTDKSEIENQLRENGFSAEAIVKLLQEDEEDLEELINEMEEEVDVPWNEAKGYDECEEFMWWKKKDGSSKQGYKSWADKKKSKKPKPLDQICSKIECAPYEKLDIFGCGFEARKILGAKWVVTTVDTSDISEGYQSAFWRLFKYINGANADQVRIDMTVPVIGKWWYDDNRNVTGGQVAFYIPAVHQDAPPAPTDDAVYVEQWDEVIVYDRAFGGNPPELAYYKKQLGYLLQALGNVGITTFPGMTITAGFTRPGWGRQRNEVMFVDAGSM